MRRNRWVAGLLSILIPGLGQIYGGRGDRGAAILVSAIVIGNLNLLFLLLFISTNLDPSAAWAYWIPRVGHDVMSLWSLAFWIWAIVDAWRLARCAENLSPGPSGAAESGRDPGLGCGQPALAHGPLEDGFNDTLT